MPFVSRKFGLLALTLALPAMAARPAVWVSFQVGLHGGDTALRGVRARLVSLDGPARISGADVTLYREDFVTTTRPSVQGEPVGAWPDALMPDTDEIAGETRRAFPFDVAAGEARALWVDVHVPVDAPPGEYQGTVEVTADGHRSEVAVALTVVDAELPSTPSLATAFLHRAAARPSPAASARGGPAHQRGVRPLSPLGAGRGEGLRHCHAPVTYSRAHALSRGDLRPPLPCRGPLGPGDDMQVVKANVRLPSAPQGMDMEQVRRQVNIIVRKHVKGVSDVTLTF